MSATDSPRCILGDRDVNKPVSKSPCTSPLKPSPLPNKNGKSEERSDVRNRAKLPSSPRAGATPSSTAPFSHKRGIEYLEDGQDGPVRKLAVIEATYKKHKTIEANTRDCTPRAIDGEKGQERVVGWLVRPENHNSQNIRSHSLDSSVDLTQDSWMEDSQNTTLTEPEDATALPIPTFTLTQPSAQRPVSQEEARENAEALCLRLKMAMYKIKTNQTDLPLSRVQIRFPMSKKYPYATQSLCKPPPAARNKPGADEAPCTVPTSHALREDTSTEDQSPTLASSYPTSPDQGTSHRDLATPLLPRSRIGPLLHHDPESPVVTSSVVKDRAADGLLSLMAAIP